MTEFTETAMRHMCRYPKCRSKLPAPVSNHREAFCARGCHTSFYRKRCLVCEQQMERKTEHQLLCGKRACRKALRASSDLGRYGPWLFSNSGPVVKLSMNILAGSRVLSAVGTRPPHDGVR